MSERDPIHVETYHDAEAAFTMAGALWKGKQPTPEAFQATVATLMIHMKDIRKIGHAPAPQPARAPAAAPAAPSGCPKCGGEMWNNIGNKKNPKGPDFKCKDKDCGEAVWLQKKGAKPAKPVPQKAEDFEQMPEQLEDEDDLPF